MNIEIIEKKDGAFLATRIHFINKIRGSFKSLYSGKKKRHIHNSKIMDYGHIDQYDFGSIGL